MLKGLQIFKKKFIIVILLCIATLYIPINQSSHLFQDIKKEYLQEKDNLESQFISSIKLPDYMLPYLTQAPNANLDCLFLPKIYTNYKGAYISGFHHDYQNKIAQSEAFFVEKIQEKNSFYAAYVSSTGYNADIPPSQKQYKTFFPAQWSRKKLITVLCKVLSRAKIDAKRSSTTHLVLKGYIQKSIVCIFVFHIQKQSFVAIYPLIYF